MLLSSTTGCSAQAKINFILKKKKKKGAAILYKAELAKRETNSRGMNDKSQINTILQA